MSELDKAKLYKDCEAAMSRITCQFDWGKAVFRYKIKFEDDRDFHRAAMSAAENILQCNAGKWPAIMVGGLVAEPEFVDWLHDHYINQYCENKDGCTGCGCIYCSVEQADWWECDSCGEYNNPDLCDDDECSHCGESSNLS